LKDAQRRLLNPTKGAIIRLVRPEAAIFDVEFEIYPVSTRWHSGPQGELGLRILNCGR